jgi:hypothetical protein
MTSTNQAFVPRLTSLKVIWLGILIQTVSSIQIKLSMRST